MIPSVPFPAGTYGPSYLGLAHLAGILSKVKQSSKVFTATPNYRYA
jgi:hypothetical protein